MSVVTLDTDLLLDSLHEACEYIPKRAIRYFTDPETSPRNLSLLLEEMEEVLENPDPFVESESQFLFHAIMIFAHLHEAEAVSLFLAIGHLDPEAIDVFLGKHLFDSVPLALAELLQNRIEVLKEMIEDTEQDAAIRASALQAMIFLFGRGVLTRDEVVAYFLKILKDREEKIPYLYDLIAAAAAILHPEGLIDELRLAYAENYIDPEQVSLEQVEEMLEMSKQELVEHAREEFNADLEDLIGHYEQMLGKGKKNFFERNDPCPCCSGLKYKKCCY